MQIGVISRVMVKFNYNRMKNKNVYNLHFWLSGGKQTNSSCDVVQPFTDLITFCSEIQKQYYSPCKKIAVVGYVFHLFSQK